MSMRGSEVALSANEARSLAVAGSLGCHGFPDSTSVLAHTGLLQLDPLARVAKAHRLTCLTRMVATESLGRIDQRLWTAGTAAAFETWVHAACLVPVADWPLLRLHRERVRRAPANIPETVFKDVHAIIADEPGGATISQIEQVGNATRGWDWSERKHAVERMLRTGDLVCSSRLGTKRLFDLPERRIPASVLRAEPADDQILARLATKALQAMGVATCADIATYYNLSPQQVLKGLEAAHARPVTVEGWGNQAWIAAGNGHVPSTDYDPLLIGPFDNLIWDRKRTSRVFGFDYLFEAYKPAAKRRYGCYVLALLDGGQFTGRADLRRDGATLQVLASYTEPGADASRLSASLGRALKRLQGQLAS